MANPFFHNSKTDENQKEHNLYKNAVQEICEIYGRDFSYLAKTFVKKDWILGEDVAVQFNSAVSITMFIENFEGYTGNGDIFSKFGLTIDDRLTLVVQQDHFRDLILKEPEIDDILYDPVSNQIFKINFVEPDQSFNQFLGANMYYRIKCVLYRYSHEVLNTGITEVDSISTETEANIENELEQIQEIANDIIDFNEDYFGNQ